MDCMLMSLIVFLIIVFLIVAQTNSSFIGGRLSNIDHLTVFIAPGPHGKKFNKTKEWYERVFNQKSILGAGGRYRINVGTTVLKLQHAQAIPPPGGLQPVSGSMDICFQMDQDLQQTISDIHDLQDKHGDDYNFFIYGAKHGDPGTKSRTATVYQRHGRYGPMYSVYMSDPVNNLLEFTHYKGTAGEPFLKNIGKYEVSDVPETLPHDPILHHHKH